MMILSVILDVSIVLPEFMKIYEEYFISSCSSMIQVSIDKGRDLHIRKSGGKIEIISASSRKIIEVLNNRLKDVNVCGYLAQSDMSNLEYLKMVNADDKGRRCHSFRNKPIDVNTNMFSKVKAKELEKTFDINGLSLCYNIGSLGGGLNTGIRIKMERQCKYVPITKNESYFDTTGPTNTLGKLSIKMGHYSTSMGDLPIYLLSANTQMDADAKEDMRVLVFDVIARALTLNKNLSAINNTILSSYVNMETKTLRTSFNLETLGIVEKEMAASEQLRKFNMFWMIEKYGMKAETCTHDCNAILKQLNYAFSTFGLQKLRFDFCCSVSHKKINGFQESVLTLGAENFDKKVKGLYTLFCCSKFVNYNAQMSAITNGMCTIRQRGIYKCNFYSSIMTHLIPRYSIQSKLPKNALNVLIRLDKASPKYGGKEFKQSIHVLLDSLNNLNAAAYPVRLESKVSVVGMYDFFDYVSYFVENGAFYVTTLETFQSRLSSLLESILTTVNMDSIAFMNLYKITIIEIYTKEFLLKGSLNSTFVSSRVLASMKECGDALNSGEDITKKIASVINKEEDVYSAIECVQMMMKYDRRFRNRKIDTAEKFLDLMAMDVGDVEEYLFGMFSNEMEENTHVKFSSLPTITPTKHQSGQRINMTDYINGLFRSESYDKKWKYLICYNFAINNGKTTEVSTKRFFYSQYKENKIRYTMELSNVSKLSRNIKYCELMYNDDATQRADLLSVLQAAIHSRCIMPKRIAWTQDEVDRVLHGMNWYGTKGHLYTKIIDDFTYRFYFTRNNISFINVMKNRIVKHGLCLNDEIARASKTFDVRCFNARMHFEYLACFNIFLTEKEKAMYQEVLNIDYKNKHSKFTSVSEIGITESELNEINEEQASTQNKIMLECNDASYDVDYNLTSHQSTEHKKICKAGFEFSNDTIEIEQGRLATTNVSKLFTVMQERWITCIKEKLKPGSYNPSRLRIDLLHSNKRPSVKQWKKFIDKACSAGLYRKLDDKTIEIN